MGWITFFNKKSYQRFLIAFFSSLRVKIFFLFRVPASRDYARESKNSETEKTRSFPRVNTYFLGETPPSNAEEDGLASCKLAYGGLGKKPRQGQQINQQGTIIVNKLVPGVIALNLFFF